MPTYDSHCDVCGLYRRCVLLTHTMEVCEGCLREGLSELAKPAPQEENNERGVYAIPHSRKVLATCEVEIPLTQAQEEDMYERFTNRARKVMQLANQEAQRFNHEYIGTEHILLGLIKEGTGVAACVLNNLGADLRTIRIEVEMLVPSGPTLVLKCALPQTPRAKRVIQYSMEESRNLKDNHVGTEHILLGLVREEDGDAPQVLRNLGLKLEDVRAEVLNLLGNAAETYEQLHKQTEELKSEVTRLRSAITHWAAPVGIHRSCDCKLCQALWGIAEEKNQSELLPRVG